MRAIRELLAAGTDPRAIVMAGDSAGAALSLAALRAFADLCIGAAGHAHPLASPLFADLAGLPPLLIQVGTNEVLLDDAVNLAGRAGTDDVEVTLEIGTGLPHVVQHHYATLDEAGAALDRAAHFLTTHLLAERSVH